MYPCSHHPRPSTLLWRHNGRDSVSNHQPHDCLLNRLFRRRSKKTSKLRVTGLCAGNSPETGEFPAQMTSNAENVSIWWRHHEGQVNQFWLLANLTLGNKFKRNFSRESHFSLTKMPYTISSAKYVFLQSAFIFAWMCWWHFSRYLFSGIVFVNVDGSSSRQRRDAGGSTKDFNTHIKYKIRMDSANVRRSNRLRD